VAHDISSVDHVQVGTDLEFEYRWHTLQQIAWTLIGLLIITGLLGIFGRGPLSKIRIRSDTGAATLEYERFARYKTPATLKLFINGSTSSRGEVTVSVSRTLLETIKIEQTAPTPVAVRAVSRGMLPFVLRLIPRRVGNIMTPFEYILLFLLGGVSVQAVVGDDRSLVNSALGASTIAFMHMLIATLKQRFPTFAKIVDGTPVIVIEDGQWRDREMSMLRVQPQDVMAAARQQGAVQPDQIHMAIVERNGSITILKRDSPGGAQQTRNRRLQGEVRQAGGRS
jgi:uncharacterized membrane protein YcaP (DUF421 family)